MSEFVRVDDASIREIEAFLTHVLAEPVRLGRVWLAAGVAGLVVAGLARASGVTVGRVVFVGREAQRALARAAPARLHLDVLDGLLVHECVHVHQYVRTGTLRFLREYALSYYLNIRKQSTDASVWELADVLDRAYRGIPFEVAAFTVEHRWYHRRSPPPLDSAGKSVR